VSVVSVKWNVTMAYIKDFDGYLIELVEYAGAAPAGLPDRRDNSET
jgi:hypothetical protein